MAQQKGTTADQYAANQAAAEAPFICPVGSRCVTFENKEYEFPGDATDLEISGLLKAIPASNAPNAPQARTWKDFGKDVARASLDALPAAGAIVGGIVSTPETGGATTLPGIAIGAGVGRSLRDLIAENTGLEPRSGVVGKTGRIMLDSATAAALPGPIEHPVLTLKDVGKGSGTLILSLLPRRLAMTLKAAMSLNKTTAETGAAPILTRPMWQTWVRNVPDDLTAAEVKRLEELLASPQLAKNPQARAAITTAIRTRLAKFGQTYEVVK